MEKCSLQIILSSIILHVKVFSVFSCVHRFYYPRECSYICDRFLLSSYRYNHDDVIKWKHFPRNWPFVLPHKGQWRGALMFSLICVWKNGWVNNLEAGDLRRHHVHYDVTVIRWAICHLVTLAKTLWSKTDWLTTKRSISVPDICPFHQRIIYISGLMHPSLATNCHINIYYVKCCVDMMYIVNIYIKILRSVNSIRLIQANPLLLWTFLMV